MRIPAGKGGLEAAVGTSRDEYIEQIEKYKLEAERLRNELAKDGEAIPGEAKIEQDH